MTPQEQQLLSLHNRIFTRQAIKATIYDGSRFYFDYADGKRKHDYWCGDGMAERLRRSISQ